MNNEIIIVKQLPVIQEQLQQIKEDITGRVETALSLVCNTETLKTIKDERAKLNKELKQWEDKRKEVKKAILSPYEKFETVYKECISNVFNKADKELKNKIANVENGLKEEKKKEVVTYFSEYAEANNVDFVSFEQAGINVTLSASLKSLKEKAKAFIDRICDDLHLIDTQEHKEEILYEYKQSLNVSGAITMVNKRHKAIEEVRAKANEVNTTTLSLPNDATCETVTLPYVEPLAPPVEEEKVLILKFTVKGTRPQLNALKDFLERNGYDYE